MNSPIAKFVNWQLSSGQLDHWTSYHIAAGLFIAKVAQGRPMVRLFRFMGSLMGGHNWSCMGNI